MSLGKYSKLRSWITGTDGINVDMDKYPSGDKNKSALKRLSADGTAYSNHKYHKKGCREGGLRTTGIILFEKMNSCEYFRSKKNRN